MLVEKINQMNTQNKVSYLLAAMPKNTFFNDIEMRRGFLEEYILTDLESEAEIETIEEIVEKCSTNDLVELNSIISQFAKLHNAHVLLEDAFEEGDVVETDFSKLHCNLVDWANRRALMVLLGTK